ncbi:cytochrome b5-like heme steroid binding domain containing protein [Stylonychia lemnae]|uniref:Cytochrome b5-like heme steroid binding domain containing protein n=1 Tax=Stylonychia lemnae TaxID=5949 RepID=A0A078AC90_STYLE|nr:cytochrome b5-like heme steroid binding domain containing protein [Stylonychia lemnae]|eukprot:CDW78413.1 cytochrome b5-like heme steroid binding domain containing protein [Stylonychia lemnae]
MKIIGYVLLLAILQQLYQAKNKKEVINTLTKDFGQHHFEMSVTPDDYIQFKVTLPFQQYFAIGFGKDMYGTNMISFQSYNSRQKAQSENLYSSSETRPAALGDNILEMTEETVDTNKKIITVKRPFVPDPNPQYNYKIQRQVQIPLIWAKNTKGSYLTEHQETGSFEFTINLDGSFDGIIDNGGTDNSLYYIHGWILWAAWGILGLVQIAFNRYLKIFWKWNKYVHYVCGMLIVITTFVMGYLALQKRKFKIEREYHHATGFGCFVGVGLLPIGGFVVAILLNTLRWNTGFVLKMKLGHKIFGYTLIALSQFAILTGGLKWSSFNNDNNPYVIIHICLYFLVLIVCEGIYYKFQERENNFIEPKVTILRSEFKKRVAGGEQLVILDDLVLDISKFKLSHPGGKFLLDYNIGRDISKFFYGGYTLENGGGCSPHSHSNMARCIVNTLVIARLEEKAKTFAARIVTSTEVGRNTNTFTLKAEGPEVHFKLPSSTDVTAIGRHFLIRSFSNSKVKRHYTVCTCMKKEIYDELCNALRQFQAGERILFNNAVLQENWNSDKSEVVCTVKNYNKRGGVSHRIHTAYNDLYQIKGLLGKGLGIHQEGNHVAFVAGTGILVFVDLVAFLIRQDLNLLDDVQNKILDRKKFKFTLYASFPNEEQVLCHDLIQGLQDIVSKNDEKNFELILRISSQSKQRWDEQFIQRQLEVQTQTDLRKIWVCGPPSMNELFDKTLDANATKYNLNRNQWEIL